MGSRTGRERSSLLRIILSYSILLICVLYYIILHTVTVYAMRACDGLDQKYVGWRTQSAGLINAKFLEAPQLGRKVKRLI